MRTWTWWNDIEMARNDPQKILIGCCLLRGGSTRLKIFEGHFTVTQVSFKMEQEVPVSNDFEMIEWWWNEGHLRIQFFSSLPKTTSSLLNGSFLCHSMPYEMTRNEISYWRDLIPVSFCTFKAVFSFKNDAQMTEWEEMKGYFWTKAKPLISKIISFDIHSVIQCQNPIHHVIIPVIWRSFLIPMSFLLGWFQIHPPPTLYSFSFKKL